MQNHKKHIFQTAAHIPSWGTGQNLNPQKHSWVSNTGSVLSISEKNQPLCNWTALYLSHYSDVIMSAMASQISGFSVVCSTVCSGEDQRKHPISKSLACVRGIHGWPVDSLHKGPVTRKMFPFGDVIMHLQCHRWYWSTSTEFSPFHKYSACDRLIAGWKHQAYVMDKCPLRTSVIDVSLNLDTWGSFH